jgi:hypothetical protein
MDKDILKGFGFLAFEVCLILFGVYEITTISPYRECSIFSHDWPMCEYQLKSSVELFGDYFRPVFIIVIGSILCFVVGLVLVLLIRNRYWNNYRYFSFSKG